jgi:hypothetical protein
VRARIRTKVAAEFFHAEHGRPPADPREISGTIAKLTRPKTDAVAGYDLTFSPVKSVSTLWAVADQRTSAIIESAHHAAVADALRFIEDHALYTRTGAQGVRQVDVCGLVAAAFVHRDSRAGDPDLHTHVAVANKVQTLDGRLLSIDGRLLFKATVAAAECYSTALEAHLTHRLGVRFVERPNPDPRKRPIREIVGVDPRLNQRWSTRRAAIEARTGELATRFRPTMDGPPPRPKPSTWRSGPRWKPGTRNTNPARWPSNARPGGSKRRRFSAATRRSRRWSPAPCTRRGSRFRNAVESGYAPPPAAWWRRCRPAGRPGRSGTSTPKHSARSGPSNSHRTR